VVGALITPIVLLIRYLTKLFKHHPLCAKWYTYHYTFKEGRMEMLSGVYKIKRGLFSGLSVSAENSAPTPNESKTQKTLFYRGTVEQDGAHYIMIIKGTNHKEKLVIRFAERIPPNDKILPAIWLAYDHDHHVASGVQMFCRQELSQVEAEARLASWITVSDGAMRLRETPSATPPRSAVYATTDLGV
jgi:hypothetical protein